MFDLKIVDPGPQICAAVADARQTADPGRRSRAYALLIAHVQPLTESIGRHTRDPADLHDAGVEAIVVAIARYDCSRGKRFGALYSKVLTRRLTSLARRRLAKSRGSGKTVHLSHKMDAAAADDAFARIDLVIDHRALFSQVSQLLTPYQARVLDLYLRGWTYKQIARGTNCEFGQSAGPKRIDNMLARIKTICRQSATDTPTG